MYICIENEMRALSLPVYIHTGRLAFLGDIFPARVNAGQGVFINSTLTSHFFRRRPIFGGEKAFTIRDVRISRIY